MGFISNKIVAPLVDVFGEGLQNSNFGKVLFKNLNEGLQDTAESTSGIIAKSIRDSADEIADRLSKEISMGSASAGAGGIVGGIYGGAIAGGGAMTGGALIPVINNYLQSNDSLDLNSLSPEAKAKILQIVKRKI